jgi:hypothetical protein
MIAMVTIVHRDMNMLITAWYFRLGKGERSIVTPRKKIYSRPVLCKDLHLQIENIIYTVCLSCQLILAVNWLHAYIQSETTSGGDRLYVIVVRRVHKICTIRRTILFVVCPILNNFCIKWPELEVGVRYTRIIWTL